MDWGSVFSTPGDKMQDSHIGGPSHKVSAIIIALLSLGTLWVVTFKSGGHVDKILSSH